MTDPSVPDIALYRRFPALRRIPRVRLCTFPSPVMSASAIHPRLWLKRDDLNADAFGGNKGVAPRIAANKRRVAALVRGARKLLFRVTGEQPATVPRGMVRVVHDVYGGAYGRVLRGADGATGLLDDAYGIRLDSTYSAKAFVTALACVRELDGPTLFWLTFDGRCLDAS